MLFCAGYEPLATGNTIEQVLPFVAGEPCLHVLREPASTSSHGPLTVAIAIDSNTDDPDTFCQQRAVVMTEDIFYACCSCARAARFSCQHVVALDAFAEQVQLGTPFLTVCSCAARPHPLFVILQKPAPPAQLSAAAAFHLTSSTRQWTAGPTMKMCLVLRDARIRHAY